jgi:hypothetical protein
MNDGWVGPTEMPRAAPSGSETFPWKRTGALAGGSWQPSPAEPGSLLVVRCPVLLGAFTRALVCLVAPNDAACASPQQTVVTRKVPLNKSRSESDETKR